MLQSTQNILTRVPEPTRDEMELTVVKSHAAWLTWREMSVLKRQNIMFKSVQPIIAFAVVDISLKIARGDSQSNACIGTKYSVGSFLYSSLCYMNSLMGYVV